MAITTRYWDYGDDGYAYPVYPTPARMSTVDFSGAGARRAAAYHEQRAIQLAEAAERWENRPTEPKPDKDGCAVIWAKKRFFGGTKNYTYSGVYAKNLKKWYLSGHLSPQHGMTWDALLSHLYQEAAEIEIWTPKDWEQLQ